MNDGGGGDEAIISEEYTEPGFWSSCFRMFLKRAHLGYICSENIQLVEL